MFVFNILSKDKDIKKAYNPIIAKEAIALQTFGENFNINRMTWIKPSFLWMMYRSNWGTKKNQECILDKYPCLKNLSMCFLSVQFELLHD